MTFDLDLWPIDLNINRGHLLIKDYLPTKFETLFRMRISKGLQAGADCHSCQQIGSGSSHYSGKKYLFGDTGNPLSRQIFQ